MILTLHAEVRAHQRAIPPLILEWLDRYGAHEHDSRGAMVAYFDKRSRRLLEKDVGKRIVDRLDDLLDTYLVVDDDNVVTVGHRYKRIPREPTPRVSRQQH